MREHEAAHARRLSTLLAAMGRLGLQAAQRTALAACWAAWMDTLPVLRELRASPGWQWRQAPCPQDVPDARQLLHSEGWWDCSSRREACSGASPTRSRPQKQATGGNTQRGFVTDNNWIVVKANSCAGRCARRAALTRSHSSAHAGAWPTITTSETAITLEPQAMQLARRLAFAAAALPCVMFTEGGPSGHGGLGLRSAVRHALAACWVSWVNCLQLFARREPAFDECLSASLAGHDLLPLALDPACSASPGQQC